jgi:hypothetical protein
MQTINQFTAEYKQLLTAFETWWLAQHAKDPKVYPLELAEDNAGLWLEMFLEFINSRNRP